MQLLIFNIYGIFTSLEAAKYVEQAELLRTTGSFSSNNFVFYSTEILIIYLSKATNTFPYLPVIFNLIFNAISIVLFYKLSFRITNDRLVTLITTLIFLGMFHYHLYNVYLYTESLYFSFGIIYTYLLFSLKNLTIPKFLLLMFLVSILYFTRPTGVFFIPATLLYLILKFYPKNAILLISISVVGGIIILYYLLNFALASGGEFDFLLPYLDERVICGVPTISKPHNILMPVERNSIQGLWYIITHHTSLFFELAIRRLIAFWSMIRSHYSFLHNAYVALYFYSIYLLIILGIKKMSQNFLPELWFFLCLISFIMITVMMSCDEWHNRFILALLPFFLLMANGAFIKKNTLVKDVNQRV